MCLKGAEKPIKYLELLRVKGAGCNYSSFELLLQHEKSVDVSTRSKKSGTASILALYHHLDFMLLFLTKLEEALDKNEAFGATDKITIYQVTNEFYRRQ